MTARDSRLKREAMRPRSGLSPKGESGGAEGNRPTHPDPRESFYVGKHFVQIDHDHVRNIRRARMALGIGEGVRAA